MDGMKFITDYNYYRFKLSKFLDISGYCIEEKEKVLKYLKSFEKCAYTTECVTDIPSGKLIDGLTDDRYTDGVYVWYESDIYNFERYDLKLNDNFIEYVLSK